MRLSITHEIRYAPETDAKSAIAAFRLFPRDCDSQAIENWRIDFNRDCSFSPLDDCFGNDCRTLYTQGPVDELSMIARGVATTSDAAGLVRGAIEKFPVELFLRDTDATQPSAAIRAFAQAATVDAQTLLDKPHRLMKALHETFKMTDSAAPDAAKAFEAGGGANVDRAHVMAAAARALGLPARLVCGYLFDPAGEDAQTMDAPHVWTEIHVADIGWIGFDPAACLCAHEGHVRMAVGLDYPAIEPIRAFFYGAGGVLKPDVKITLRDETPDLPEYDVWTGSQSQSQSQ